MWGKRQISHAEEFQIIYVAAPPSRRRGTAPHSSSVKCQLHSDFLPKTTVWEGGGNLFIFCQEKPDKHYLSRIIKVHINQDVDSMYPRYDVMEVKLYLRGRPSPVP